MNRQSMATTWIGRMARVAMVAFVTGVPGAFAQAPGTSEGIKVHGDWVIDVRNADGTLASHHEFENALTDEGRQVLMRAVSRTATLGRWAILFPCGNDMCALREPDATVPATPPESRNLTLTWNQTDFSMELNGSIVAPADISVGVVRTSVRNCFGTTDPDCPNGLGMSFTERTLPAAIAVQQGQIVQIRVRFSFS